MEEHLIPVGFVEEAEREDNGTDYQERRQFRLTAAGAAWLDEHVDDVALPKSRVETQRMAYEAQEMAESARNSVQSYRKKVNRIQNDVDDVEDDVDELEEQVDSIDTTVGYHSGSLQGLRDRKADEADVEDLREELNSRIGSVREQQQESVNNLGGKIEELHEEIATLNEENNALRAEIKKMQRSRLDRLREWFA